MAGELVALEWVPFVDHVMYRGNTGAADLNCDIYGGSVCMDL